MSDVRRLEQMSRVSKLLLTTSRQNTNRERTNEKNCRKRTPGVDGNVILVQVNLNHISIMSMKHDFKHTDTHMDSKEEPRLVNAGLCCRNRLALQINFTVLQALQATLSLRMCDYECVFVVYDVQALMTFLKHF